MKKPAMAAAAAVTGLAVAGSTWGLTAMEQKKTPARSVAAASSGGQTSALATKDIKLTYRKTLKRVASGRGKIEHRITTQRVRVTGFVHDLSCKDGKSFTRITIAQRGEDRDVDLGAVCGKKAYFKKDVRWGGFAAVTGVYVRVCSTTKCTGKSTLHIAR
ncbi:hypothetical protein SMC26_39635 [Actinomadura fulvescens]|uniref:Secreted protein n=1 Tax=Actinomadura fulvescens TaxID=46160 RepID=A0ABP6D0S4_9ACTN